MAEELPTREAMEFDVVIVGGGPVGPVRGDFGRSSLTPTRRSAWWKRAAKSAPISCPAR